MNLLLLLFIIFILWLLINTCKIENFEHSFLQFKKSNIHGNGLFSIKPLKKDEFIFTAIENENITSAGRKINHSWDPNSYLKQEKNIYNIYAKQNINANEELTIDYRDTPDFIAKPPPDYI